MVGFDGICFAPVDQPEESFTLTPVDIHSDDFVFSLDEAPPLPVEITVAVDPADLQRLVDPPLDPSSRYGITFYSEEPVPARRHKRRRTQKKWIRRFGYRMAWFLTEISNCEYKDSETGLLLVNHGEMKRRRKNAPGEVR
jgi:hypothetical protein